MEVRKIENPPGTLTKIEFTRTGDEDFKQEIRTWLQTNQPGMNYEQFFGRLEEFGHGVCRISME